MEHGLLLLNACSGERNVFVGLVFELQRVRLEGRLQDPLEGARLIAVEG